MTNVSNRPRTRLFMMSAFLFFSTLFLVNGDSTFAATAAPAATATPADSSSFDPARYAGKVVYLDFWASWCPPCKHSFPWMKELQARHGAAGFEVVAVNLDKRRDSAMTFLREASPNFRIVWDPEGRIAKEHELKGMPTTILFDRQGRPRATHVGYREKERDAVEAEIQRLLEEKAGGNVEAP